MKKNQGRILFSASDLNGFLGCRHSTYLDLQDLEDRLPRAKDSAQDKLIQQMGHEHEAEYLETLKGSCLRVVEVLEEGGLAERVQQMLRPA